MSTVEELSPTDLAQSMRGSFDPQLDSLPALPAKKLTKQLSDSINGTTKGKVANPAPNSISPTTLEEAIDNLKLSSPMDDHPEGDDIRRQVCTFSSHGIRPFALDEG